MNTLTNFVGAHSGLFTAAAAYVFLAIVGSMPAPGDPRPLAQKVYETFYVALHMLANRVPAKYQPPSGAEVKNA